MTEAVNAAGGHKKEKLPKVKLPPEARKKKRKYKAQNNEETVFVEEIALSSLYAKDAQLGRLSFADRRLVPLSIGVEGENARMTYQMEGLRPLEDIRRESRADQYRILSNVLELAELADHYDFELDPGNLYYDRNLSVRVLRRDLRNEENEKDFALQYKCLCGHVLQRRYDYTAYRNGGLSLLRKQSRLKEIYPVAAEGDISFGLGVWHDFEQAKIKRTKRLIGKKSFAALLAALILTIAVAAGSAVYAGYILLIEQPYNARLMRAGNAYLIDDYDGVIQAVQADTVSSLPKETRYVLARSYVYAESLSQQQKSNILSLLTMKTDDTMLNYWIELGRRSYGEARDIAERIQNDEWLLYCLLKQEVDVRNDASISGAEKTSRLESLNKEIETLSKKLDEQGAEGSQ